MWSELNNDSKIHIKRYFGFPTKYLTFFNKKIEQKMFEIINDIFHVRIYHLIWRSSSLKSLKPRKFYCGFLDIDVEDSGQIKPA